MRGSKGDIKRTTACYDLTRKFYRERRSLHEAIPQDIRLL